MDAVVARKCWRTLEPYHGLIYFSPAAASAFEEIGLEPRHQYFASRAAPLGAVPAEVVIATFYNFHPQLVRAAIPEAWERADPSTVLAARWVAADRALREALGEETLAGPAIEEALGLARTAAEAAAEDVTGRPLFAAHAALDWPDEPHVALWHAITLLREHRGDGHIAALLADEVGPCEALVMHAATGDVPVDVLRSTRAWSDAEWAEGEQTLRERGWLDDTGALTDELAAKPYECLEPDELDELISALEPLAALLLAAQG